MEVNSTPVTATPTPAPTNEPNVSGTPNSSSAPKPVATPAGEEQLYEIKVDGKVRKLTLEEMKAEASLGGGARARMEEAAKMRKDAEALKAKLSKDFIEGLQEAGFSKDQIRAKFEAWYKKEYIDPEMMTEEEKLREENRRFREEKELEQRTRQEREQKAREEELDRQTRIEIQTQLIKTLESSGLPKTRFTLSRMVYFQRQNLDKGYDAPMEVIVHQVKQERQQIVQSLVESSTPEQLVEMFGQGVVEKLRKFDLERLEPKSTMERKPREYRKPQKRTMADVDKFLNEIRRSPVPRRP